MKIRRISQNISKEYLLFFHKLKYQGAVHTIQTTTKSQIFQERDIGRIMTQSVKWDSGKFVTVKNFTAYML